jgi:hypothetical protein
MGTLGGDVGTVEGAECEARACREKRKGVSLMSLVSFLIGVTESCEPATKNL